MAQSIPFYRLTSSLYSDHFALPSIAEGTFEPILKRCHKCGRSLEPRTRLPELVIKWVEIDPYSPGTDLVADFYCLSSNGPLIVSERLRQFLEASNYGKFQFGPVQMVQDPKLRRPKKVTARTKKRVWLPYEGPPLFEFSIVSRVNVDLDLNKFTRSEHLKCSACNHVVTLLLRPPEHPNNSWIVKQSEWDGSDFFQFSNPILERMDGGKLSFVTESAKERMCLQNFTNIEFTRFGTIE